MVSLPSILQSPPRSRLVVNPLRRAHPRRRALNPPTLVHSDVA